MTKDDSKGFEFNDVEDSEIENNSATGFNKGFEGNRIKGSSIKYNTVDRESRQLIDKLRLLEDEISKIRDGFIHKEEMKEIIEGIVEEVNKQQPKKSVVQSLGHSLSVILTGAAGNVLGDEYPDILKTANDAIEALNSMFKV